MSISENDTIAAGEAARRLGVSVATIKRWGTQGLLVPILTQGGHRRFRLSEIHRLADTRRNSDSSDHASKWLDLMFDGDTAAIVALLQATRASLPSWKEAADTVAAVIVRLGQAWELGDCTVYEEHVASEALRRAMSLCALTILPPAQAPKVLLVTVEGELHTLGLSLAELVVREAGFRPIWVGDGPPVREVRPMLRGLSPKLVVLTASARLPQRTVTSYEAAMREATGAIGAALIVAGGACWMQIPSNRQAQDFRHFGGMLAELKNID